MALRDTLDTLYLCRLAKPQADRFLFRCVRDQRVQSIVELGMDNTERTLRLLRLAQRCSPSANLRYAGIDLFDARSAGQAPLLLKDTHKLLSNRAHSVRLIPGDPLSGLARSANLLANTQLLIIASDLDPVAMERAWMYIPRMVTPDSWVVTGSSAHGFNRIAWAEVEQRSEAAARARRVA